MREKQCNPDVAGRGAEFSASDWHRCIVHDNGVVSGPRQRDVDGRRQIITAVSGGGGGGWMVDADGWRSKLVNARFDGHNNVDSDVKHSVPCDFERIRQIYQLRQLFSSFRRGIICSTMLAQPAIYRHIGRSDLPVNQPDLHCQIRARRWPPWLAWACHVMLPTMSDDFHIWIHQRCIGHQPDIACVAATTQFHCQQRRGDRLKTLVGWWVLHCTQRYQ